MSQWRIKKVAGWPDGYRYVPQKKVWWFWMSYDNIMDITIAFSTEQEARDWIAQRIAFKQKKTEYLVV